MDGIYLAPPHGELIYTGRKSSIVKDRPFPEMVGSFVLVSGDKAYGEIALDEAKIIPLHDFDAKFSEHRVSVKRREGWWPHAKEFYSYPIQSFTPYECPLPVERAAGVQTMMGEVKFKEEQMPWKVFKRGDEFCVYKIDGESNPVGDSLGCHDTVEKARAQQQALYAAEERGEMKDLELVPDDDVKVVETPPAVTESIAEDVRAVWSMALKAAQDGKEYADEKVGRRLRTDKVSDLSAIKDALEKFWKWVTNQDEQPKPEDKAFPICSVKEMGNDAYMIIWPTNAFIDREGEIFSTDAIQAHVDANREKEVKGEAWYHHWEGTKFGDVVFQDIVGRMMVEVVRFDKTQVGNAFKELFLKYPNGHPEVSPEGWGASHGYVYRLNDRLDAVYDWFDKKESSVLPLSYAANQHNPKPEVIKVDAKAKAELSALLGDEVAEHIVQTGEGSTEEKERAGVERKEAEQPSAVQPEAPETEVPEDQPEQADQIPVLDTEALAKTISEQFKIDDLIQAFTEITEAQKEFKEKLDNIEKRLVEAEKTADEKLEDAKDSEIPVFPWASRPSQSETNLIQEGDPLLAKTIQVPSAIQGLANQILEGR